MFTGLIADLGTVTALERSEDGVRLGVRTELAAEAADGDSIAVNGVCLTVTGSEAGELRFDVMNQTVELTALVALEPGSRVNLEPALRASDRLGGHIVQGHVDGVGTVTGTRADGIATRVEVELGADLHRYVVEHGSIALNGVSLTVATLLEDGVEVSLIPETLERTMLGQLAAGDPLNVEIDVVARYVERLLQGFKNERTR